MKALAGLAIALVVAACSKKPKSDDDRPASFTDDMVAMTDRYLDFMTKLGDDFAATGGDCTKALAVVTANAPTRKALGTEGQAAMGKLRDDPAGQAWFEKKYTPRLTAAIDKMKPVVESCMHDPQFAAALDEAHLLPRKRPATSP